MPKIVLLVSSKNRNDLLIGTCITYQMFVVVYISLTGFVY